MCCVVSVLFCFLALIRFVNMSVVMYVLFRLPVLLVVCCCLFVCVNVACVLCFAVFVLLFFVM